MTVTAHAHVSVNQDNLKKTITTTQATGIAFNQIVGGGIVSLTGIAIAMTGGGVPIAFIIAAISIVIVSFPYAAIGSAMPVTGGAYTYGSRLLHPLAGYGNMVVMVLAQTSLGIYGIAAGQYMNSLNEWFNPTFVAVFLISFFYLANLLGAAIGARLGVIMSVIMLLGFGLFIVVGLLQVDWVNYPPILPEGFLALIEAAALLTFATGGATVIVELGGEMRTPGKSIPVAMIGGTLLAAVMYVLVAIVGVGVLPVEEVAGQPLSVVAREFLSPPAFVFFILGGAMVAVISTMNAQLLTGSKSLLAAVDDGWFPSKIGSVNKRFGTPHYLLSGLFIVGLLPTVFAVPLDILASSVAAVGQVIFIMVIICALRLRYAHPELHASAPFKLGLQTQWVLSVVGVVVCTYQGYLLLSSSMTAELGIILAVCLVVACAWGAIRYPHVKRVLAARKAATGVLDAEPVAV